MTQGTSSTGQPEPKGLVYARTIQRTLNRFGPLDFPTLLHRSGLQEESKVKAGLRWSRRNKDNALLVNEIIVAAKDMAGSYVYFLAATDAEAADYEKHRRAIALGHIASVVALEEKRYEKWPNPSRQAAIKMLEMAHQLLATAP